eukprot:62760-Amphidinium_carterae.1
MFGIGVPVQAHSENSLYSSQIEAQSRLEDASNTVQACGPRRGCQHVVIEICKRCNHLVLYLTASTAHYVWQTFNVCRRCHLKQGTMCAKTSM